MRPLKNIKPDKGKRIKWSPSWLGVREENSIFRGRTMGILVAGSDSDVFELKVEGMWASLLLLFVGSGYVTLPLLFPWSLPHRL